MSEDALIRLKNLQGSQVKPRQLADAGVGRYSYCRDLLEGLKPFGEKAARKVEDKMGWPRGCLDKDEGCGVVHSASGTIVNKSKQFSVNTEAVQLTIPTTMPYTALNLSSSIILLGSLLGALDVRSRKLIGHLLIDLAESPDDAQDVAAKAAALASTQRPVSANAALNNALTRPDAPDLVSHGSFQTKTP